MLYAHRETLPHPLGHQLAGLLVEALPIHPNLETGPQSAQHCAVDDWSPELLYEVQDERRLSGTVGVDVTGERVEASPGRRREDAIVQDTVAVVEQGVDEVGRTPPLASREDRNHPLDALPVERRPASLGV